MMNALKKLFNCLELYKLQPKRIGRKKFFFLNLFWLAWVVALMTPLVFYAFKESPFDGVTDIAGSSHLFLGLIAAYFAINTLIIFPNSLFLSIRRYHDFNLSGWWMVAVAIVTSVISMIVSALLLSLWPDHFIVVQPVIQLIINIVVILFPFLMPGTKGHNKFGEQPK